MGKKSTFLDVKRTVPLQEHLYFPDTSPRTLHKEGLQQILKTSKALHRYTCYIRKSLTGRGIFTATAHRVLLILSLPFNLKKEKKNNTSVAEKSMRD